MRRTSLILSAFLLFVLPAASAPAGAEDAIGVAMDDFSYTDTSAEPANQTAAHERRLSAFMAALRRDISADRRYRLVPSAQDGAAFKVIGGIQKTSTLVQWAKVAVIDVGAKKLVMDKLYTFRGDNDESWERAEIFVSREVMAALATPAPVALAVFDFELEDTTAASAGASAASDASYLAEVTGSVREALGQSGRYRIVDAGGEAVEGARLAGLRWLRGGDRAKARRGSVADRRGAAGQPHRIHARLPGPRCQDRRGAGARRQRPAPGRGLFVEAGRRPAGQRSADREPVAAIPTP